MPEQSDGERLSTFTGPNVVLNVICLFLML